MEADKAEAAAFVRAMAFELSEISSQFGLRELTYLLDMAAMEAGLVLGEPPKPMAPLDQTVSAARRSSRRVLRPRPVPR